MYASDPSIWMYPEVSLQKHLGKFNPAQYRRRQTGGGGIVGMYAKRPYMIPVNPHVTSESEEKVVVGQQV